MPHCRLGREVKVGDRVLVECVVEAVQPGLEYCNVNLRTVHPMPPYETGSTFTLNTKQVSSILTVHVDVPPEETDAFMTRVRDALAFPTETD